MCVSKQSKVKSMCMILSLFTYAFRYLYQIELRFVENTLKKIHWGLQSNDKK